MKHLLMSACTVINIIIEHVQNNTKNKYKFYGTYNEYPYNSITRKKT